jgi:AraC-like DNA-binding protein
METDIGRPAAPLLPYIGSYVGYRYSGFPPGLHRGMPGRNVGFIIGLDRPVDLVEMPDRAQAPARLQASVAGLHPSSCTIRHDGHDHGIAVDITPLGTRALLGLPAGAIAGVVLELDEVLGTDGAELVDRLRGAHTWAERWAVLDDVLVRRLTALGSSCAEPQPEVGWAWRRLIQAEGNLEVTALADEVGWSRRHLGHRFRQEIGLSPKVAGRVMRFQRSRNLLGRRPERRPSLAAVAATCGFFDQAHLTREWRNLAGCTPTAWLSDDLPSVQDEPVPPGGC